MAMLKKYISRYAHVYALRSIRIIIPRAFNTHTACNIPQLFLIFNVRYRLTKLDIDNRA